MGIRIENLEKTFRNREGQPVRILNVPKLEIDDGTEMCLVGGSGSGKTTLLNVIAGITLPTAGSVKFGDVDITKLSESARDRFRAQNIGYVFQTFNLLHALTVLENVMAAQSFAGHRGKDARKKAEDILKRVGLGERLNEKTATLSVGEQQRTAIARAVVNDPRIVLADEPTANLDEKNGDEVLALLREVTKSSGSMLLIVTHERRIVEKFKKVLPLAEVNR